MSVNKKHVPPFRHPIHGPEEAINSTVFIDKSRMVLCLNEVVRTKDKYASVSRPRRFGKTMAVDMLCAYYGRGADSRKVFEQRKLSRGESQSAGGSRLSWDAYLGAFDVVRVVMTDFFGEGTSPQQSMERLQRLVVRDLVREYSDADYFDKGDLAQSMADVFALSGRQFVVLIDEWDVLFRVRKGDAKGQRAYLDFLRDWLKDKDYIALAYMTGILPIKKYGVHSALNMFDEYSMVSPLQLAEYTGFTEGEVRGLCEEWGLDFESVRDWYDGYEVLGVVPVGERRSAKPTDPPAWSLYAPLSVAKAVSTGSIANYWGGTETYEALAEYIRRDFDGLSERVALLMDGVRIPVNLRTYQNDMTSLNRADDVLALLVHLGYLGWDSREGVAFVPNKEVLEIFRDSTDEPAWEPTFAAYERSKELVRATWESDEARVAELLGEAHDQAENKTYNSEAALSYAVRLAYYAAQKWYTEIVELDSGKGYADVAYLPSPRCPEVPALLVELKWNRDVRTALSQIRDRRYHGRLDHYLDNLLLVGVSYNRNVSPGTEGYKRHSCRIERTRR